MHIKIVDNDENRFRNIEMDDGQNSSDKEKTERLPADRRFQKIELDERTSNTQKINTPLSANGRFSKLEMDEKKETIAAFLDKADSATALHQESLAETTTRILQDIHKRFEGYRALEIIGKDEDCNSFHYKFLSVLLLEHIGIPFVGSFANGQKYLASIVTEDGLKKGIKNIQTLYPEWKALLGKNNEYFYNRSLQFNKQGFLVDADFYQVQAFLQRMIDLHPNIGTEFGLLNGAAARNLGASLRKNYFYLDSGLRKIMTGELVKGQPESAERIISAAETVALNLNSKQTKTFRLGLYQFADPPGFSFADAFTNSDQQTGVVLAVEIPFDDI
jgi:hypothetical protein